MIWRDIGDCDELAWHHVVSGAPVNITAAWLAARPHTILCLAQMQWESSFGTSDLAKAQRNPLGLRPRGGGDGFASFADFPTAIQEWRMRIDDPTYAYAKTKTVAEYIRVYAPTSDGNDEAAYVQHIEGFAHANAILAAKGTPMPLIFEQVAHPRFEDRPIQKDEGNGQNDLGQRDVLGVTWHRILGSLRGTDTYFRRDDVGALTDYGVGVEAEDGAGDDGVILRWNDPLGRQSGWASGRVSAPYGDGLAFVNQYGIDAVNKRRASIEISGFQNTPLSEKSRNAIAGITAYWADQAHIAWDVFPITPDGFSFVVWHEEFTIGTGKRCPFSEVKAETAALIERTRGILKKAQTGTVKPKPPTYAAPVFPTWWTGLWDGKDQRAADGTIFHAIRREYTALANTKRLQLGKKDAAIIGPPIKLGETFEGWYWFRSKSDGRVYVLTPFGTRVYAAKLSPSITVRP